MPKNYSRAVLSIALLLLNATAWGATSDWGSLESVNSDYTATSPLRPVDPALWPDLFVWTDTCNVYVIRDGDAALLINLGDGSVLDQLSTIGVERVEWALFTQHHREFSQGAPRLKSFSAQLGAPQAERAFFEEPSIFRKMNVRLGDPFTVHGASYVRPPIQPVRLDRTFEDGDVFTWRGYEFRCVHTPGNSPGGMTYLLNHEDRLLAFSGGVMLDGAKMSNWFDAEWDYGFGAGLRALRETVEHLRQIAPHILLPGHGPVVRNPHTQLREYAEKLAHLEPLYLRGYGGQGGEPDFHDNASVATEVPYLGQVSPSLFKIKRPNFFGNFGVILAESGHALVVDCGLINEQFLDETLEGLQEHYGLKAIDAIIITHIHGDHFLEAPHLRETWGAPIWALDNMVDLMERPERYDYPAMIQAYGKRQADGSPLLGVKVDRVFEPGETFEWEGHRFTVDWMPGQTEFALCLWGEIDGRIVAFTGDNLFGDPENPAHTGNEAVVARNSAILEEGYIHAAEYLAQLQPDLLMGGHSFVMDQPGPLIERYRAWSYDLRDAFRALSPDDDYRYWFDPFWVRAEPYRTSLRPGESGEIVVHVRNFRPTTQRHRIVIDAPPGIVLEPSQLIGELAGDSRQTFPIHVTATDEANEGVYLAAFDITLDERRHGQLFDFVIGVFADESTQTDSQYYSFRR